ncbi:hypothetical protein [Bradyrhizobium sp. WSM1417]|uniref:hypothetical protein n=1 Tax=Bradyrhizobium sp. WSM1417 TaxID=754500 RepID=UPI0018DBF80E|nr:hypothetical protein [Bradyrhizobium sp. WSM1417]
MARLFAEGPTKKCEIYDDIGRVCETHPLGMQEPRACPCRDAGAPYPRCNLPADCQPPHMPESLLTEVEKDGWRHQLTGLDRERLACSHDWLSVVWGVCVCVLALDRTDRRLDRDIYLVLEDFGARAGCAWRETDETETDLPKCPSFWVD